MNVLSSRRPVQLASTSQQSQINSPKLSAKDSQVPTDTFESKGDVPRWKKGANGLAWALAGGAVTGATIGAFAGSGFSAYSPFTVTLALVGGGLGAWGSTVVSDKIILDDSKNNIERGLNSAVWAAAGGLVAGAAAGLGAAAAGGYRLFSPFSVTVALATGGLGAWGGSHIGGALYDSV